MKIGEDAVAAMYHFLNSLKEEIGLGKGERVFKYILPENFAGGNYIVINFLPFVYSNPINEGAVNVNIHAPKLKNNEPNTKLLFNIQRKVVEKFKDSVYLNGMIFYFGADSSPAKDNDDTYYINLKFNVTYNNLKN